MPASLANTHPGTPMGSNLVAGGATFRVWAPKATSVYVRGSFNDFQLEPQYELNKVQDHWIGFIPGAKDRDTYKFWVVGEDGGGWKRDPYARELTPVYPWDCILRDGSFPWHDSGFKTPWFHELSIYQLHIGAFSTPDWPRNAGTFLDVADKVPYLAELGFRAVQLLPIQEFPGDFSLGYNGTDYFSPEMAFGVEESRLAPYVERINTMLASRGMAPFRQSDLRGEMNQLKALVDLCHIYKLAVIFDLVYNHAGGGFGKESLWFFDRQKGSGDSPPRFWNSLYFSDREWAGGNVFNFKTDGVRQFLIDNARFFVDEFRVDGFRFDEVSVIDHQGLGHGWSFCQALTGTLKAHRAGVLLHAEYWPVNSWVLRRPADGGAGFDSTMTDGFRIALRNVLRVASYPGEHALPMGALAGQLGLDYLDARWRGVNSIENHDLVLRPKDDKDHNRMERIARLADPSNPRSWYARSRSRAAMCLLLTSPGIPMIFMGQEFLEDKQWSDDLEGHPELRIFWEGLEGSDPSSRDFLRCTRELLRLRRELPGLTGAGFRLTHSDDNDRVLVFHRWVPYEGHDVVVVMHLGNSHKHHYRIGFPSGGPWREAFNSDVYDHWVNPMVAGNGGGVFADGIAWQQFDWSAAVTLPANSVLVFGK